MPRACVGLVARAGSRPPSERERLELIKSYNSGDEGQADPQLHTHTHTHTHSFPH